MCKRRADRSNIRRVIATPTPGREQPSGTTSGRLSRQTRGVAHAPAPSVTPAKCVSCAAQNAALRVRLLSVQVVSVERLAKAAFRKPVHRPSVLTDNLAFPNCANHRSLSRPPSRRQPFPSRNLKTRVKRRSENHGESPPMPSRSECLAAQSAPGGESDDTIQPWRERPRLWPRA